MVKLKRTKKSDNPTADRLLDAGALEDEALTMDDFDDCILGVCYQFGRPPVVTYDHEKVIQKLMAQGIDDRLEAEEFFEFNQVGGWLGEFTPVFVRLTTDIF